MLGRKGRGITALHRARGHHSLHPSTWGPRCPRGWSMQPLLTCLRGQGAARGVAAGTGGQRRHRSLARLPVHRSVQALLLRKEAQEKPVGKRLVGACPPRPGARVLGGTRCISGGYQLLQPFHVGVEVLGGLSWRELPEGIVHVGVGGRDTAQQQPAASRRGIPLLPTTPQQSGRVGAGRAPTSISLPRSRAAAGIAHPGGLGAGTVTGRLLSSPGPQGLQPGFPLLV